MTAETCAPPEEHRDKEWHWLRLGDQKPRPVPWSDPTWFIPGYGWMFADKAYKEGWRYVAPCVPPGEGG